VSALKGVYVWKDGRREPVEERCVGGNTIHRPRVEGGHHVETLFHADGDLEGGDTIVYREGETRNIDREMAEARRRNEENTWNVIRRGLGLRPQRKARA
jgi:hypothetical protein